MSKPKLMARTPGGMIYVHFHDEAGKLQRKSCDTKDMREARKRMADVMAGGIEIQTPRAKIKAAQEAARTITAETVTMAHLFDRCMKTVWHPTRCRSQATVKSNVRILNRMVGGEPISGMTYPRLEALVAELRSQGYAEGTVDRKMNAVGAALTQACKELDANGKPWLAGRPVMPTLTTDNFCDRVLSEREEQIVFRIVEARAAEEPLRDWTRVGHLLRFLLDTGCRKGEALQLRDDPRHLSTRTRDGKEYTFATFYETKNKKPRTLPLSDAIVESLPYLRSVAQDGRLFPYLPGAVNYFWVCIRKDAKGKHDLDLSDVKIHTLRHSCITRKATKSGKKGDIHKISQWAGHSNIAITVKRYAHLMPEDMIDML